MMSIIVLFPIDLYKNINYLQYFKKIFLVEDTIYFNRASAKYGSIKFNILKPIYHRATMRFYYDNLKSKNMDCSYIEIKTDWVNIIKEYVKKHKTELCFFDPVDRLLESKLYDNFDEYKIIDTPRFICTDADLDSYTGKLKQTSFYAWMRKKMNLLMENDKYAGDKLTFDVENRERPYKGIENDLEIESDFNNNIYVKKAFDYVEKNIPKKDLNIWECPKNINNSIRDNIKLMFPIDSRGAELRLKNFIKTKLDKFGKYQDVILEKTKQDSCFVFHSALSPMLNIGLLTPKYIIKVIIKYYDNCDNNTKKILLNNIEGFVRQIIGWREFSRYVYEKHSDKYYSQNYFNANNKLPSSWYNATTKIIPVDYCIEKAFKYGYLHHIERLMICANYMVLSEINPVEMYRWFMEFALDSYDWVMEYNVYCMGSYSDGGHFSTKPYISSSNYILKMSTYKKNDSNAYWLNNWDSIFWKFIKKHKKKIKKIGRLAQLIKYADKHV